MLAGFKHEDLHLNEAPTTFAAEDLVRYLQPLISAHFGDAAPRLEIVDRHSSKAIAGGRYSRLRRDAVFSDRVIAIQMSIEGADFIEIHNFFLERSDSTRQSFENARRVVRGGLASGGAPFTEDIVYLEGLLRVRNFLRAAVRLDRLDCMRLLFCGKLGIEDLPALCVPVQEGIRQFPRFLPPWAKDLRFLVSCLAYSAFLNQFNLAKVRERYVDVLSHAPRLPTPID